MVQQAEAERLRTPRAGHDQGLLQRSWQVADEACSCKELPVASAQIYESHELVIACSKLSGLNGSSISNHH